MNTSFPISARPNASQRTPSAAALQGTILERIVATTMVIVVVLGGLLLSPTVRESTAALVQSNALPAISEVQPLWPLEEISLTLLADTSTN